LSMILLTEGYESLDTIIVFLVSNVRDFFSPCQGESFGLGSAREFPPSSNGGKAFVLFPRTGKANQAQNCALITLSSGRSVSLRVWRTETARVKRLRNVLSAQRCEREGSFARSSFELRAVHLLLELRELLQRLERRHLLNVQLPELIPQVIIFHFEERHLDVGWLDSSFDLLAG